LSSILKALKKIENQAADQPPLRFWRPQNHLFKADNEQITSRLRVKKRHIIILAGIVIAVGAGWAISRKFHERKPKLIAIKEALHRDSVHPPKQKEAPPDNKSFSGKPARFPEKKHAIPGSTALPQKSARLPEKKIAASDGVQKTLTSRMDVNKFKPIGNAVKTVPPPAHKSQKNTPGSFNNKTGALKQVQKETVIEKPGEKPGQRTTSDRFESLPVKRSNQTKIEIQAIAWSDDPKGRLAVINGLILRERESIDNAIVLYIGKDSVIFRKEGEEWKQMFGF
jgi:hypothetical protein